MKANETQSWQQILLQGTQELTLAGVASPLVDAKYLIEEVVGMRIELAPPPTESQLHHFFGLLQRRKNREPLQHILGKMWFYGFELEAGPDVFSVRPETELLAEAALKFLASIPSRADDEPKIVLDLCTGSGAIALVLATSATSPVEVYAVELASRTAQVAARNIAKYQAQVNLVVGDALVALPELIGKADLVVANPPYVPLTHELSPEVLQDPPLALFGGGEEGLEFPRKLISRAYDLLRVGGALMMEHADEQGLATREIAKNIGFSDPETKTDLTGRDRWLLAYKR
ncbi:MAG: peptide chain release factor N(5)-glutamine methyltransferase [Arcanobacterium sp.]|nr:peptide chain release factor N(5)-glutamine methyltransferase [Arcanobacterium sp.]